MRVIFIGGLNSGLVFSTSEKGEGYIMISSSKWEKIKIGAGIVMLKDMIKALGDLKTALQFLNNIKLGGDSLEDKLKKEKKNFLTIEMFVVLKEYQAHGYMRQLMEFAYKKADGYAVPCILDTDALNKKAKYCHLGMQHIGTRKLGKDCFLYDLMR